jgi:hypothetical protein
VIDYLEAADNERKRRRENDEPITCREYPPVGFTCKEAGFAQENWCDECRKAVSWSEG